MPADAVLIGVDGGGSGCRVAIATPDLAVIGQAAGGAANVTTDFAQAVDHICAAIAKAADAAGLDRKGLARARAHLGLAGVMDAAMSDRVTQAVGAAMPMARIVVTDDRPTSVTGALGGGDGGVIVTGTGSFVGAIRQGRARFVGGWGLVLGDQASGAWLGRRFLGRICEACDGLAPMSPLASAVLAEFDGAASAIVAFAAGARPQDFARLAPRIAEAAAAGDAMAAPLMQEGAAYLAQALTVLGHRDNDPLCPIGGLGATWARWLPAALTAHTTAPRGDALQGALHLAASVSP